MQKIEENSSLICSVQEPEHSKCLMVASTSSYRQHTTEHTCRKCRKCNVLAIFPVLNCNKTSWPKGGWTCHTAHFLVVDNTFALYRVQGQITTKYQILRVASQTTSILFFRDAKKEDFLVNQWQKFYRNQLQESHCNVTQVKFCNGLRPLSCVVL